MAADSQVLELVGVSDRVFALRRLAPFDRLRDSELLLIADIARPRRYQPGDTLGMPGRPLQRLQIVVNGSFESQDGTPASQVLGLPSLIYDHKLAESWHACKEGASVLEIERGHLFTILYECPELVLGFISIGALVRQDKAVDNRTEHDS